MEQEINFNGVKITSCPYMPPHWILVHCRGAIIAVDTENSVGINIPNLEGIYEVYLNGKK